MLKKIITFMLVAALIISTTSIYAATSTTAKTTTASGTEKTSTQDQSDWKDSLAKIKAMGIINAKDLDLNGNMSRQTFAKIIVNATGNYELADSLSGSTNYSDVSKTSDFCGYINAAVNKGFLSAYTDGKFKPQSAINFAQLCTAMVKALGYTGTDVIGVWPTGYIDKAKNLGLTKGFNLSSNSSVSTSAAITMIGRMLNTNIKKTNTTDANKTLNDSVGLLNDESNWVYGDPEVAINFNPDTKKLGKITFDPDIPILKNTYDNTVTPATKKIGEVVKISDIKSKDVVYQVYNKLNVLIYYLVVENQINGEITSILPTKYSPEKIQLDKVDYELSSDARISKFNSSSGSLNVGDTATIVLGYDGKVVDAYYQEDEDNENYAFVTSWDTEWKVPVGGAGKMCYTVELLHVDGTKKTYDIAENPSKFDKKLVTFKYLDVDETSVELYSVDYETPKYDLTIDTDQRIIGHRYATSNIKIFNCTDYTASIIKWGDIPEGTLPAKKVLFMGSVKDDDFQDVNVLLLYDLNNEQNKDFMVQRISTPMGMVSDTYKYYLRAGGVDYTYECEHQLSGVKIGSVVNMKLDEKGAIASFNEVKVPDNLGWIVQAIDDNRIKINDWVFTFNSDITLYFMNADGSISRGTKADVILNYTYNSIKMYCNRPLSNGGKVQAIVFSKYNETDN